MTIDVYKIPAGDEVTVQNSKSWNYAWIKNSGESTIYATNWWRDDDTVSDRISAYADGTVETTQILPSCATRLDFNTNKPPILFSAEAGLAEVILTNSDTCPFV